MFKCINISILLVKVVNTVTHVNESNSSNSYVLNYLIVQRKRDLNNSIKLLLQKGLWM